MHQIPNESRILCGVIDAVVCAGSAIKDRVSDSRIPTTIEEIIELIRKNDAVSTAILKRKLAAVIPSAVVDDEETSEGLLPPGEWWIIDPVEGAVNHVHGVADWCVSATLIRDNEVVHTAVHVPLSGDIYSASRGGGAFLNGKRINVSAKRHLSGSMLGTGQASPGEGVTVHRLIGESTSLMLQHALTVRVSVPSTMQLIQVADGRMDGFWQFSAIRSGLVAGALLVQEAGGLVTDVAGKPWSMASSSFLASPPQLSAPMHRLLGGLS
ncbi:myo-inositol-1(or 4)-monophosphatase [Neorhizobium sp. JUb45]|nr:myo-inositol-1(or 4)-monophosphatase [Neorhizobium sp. JUb45]